MPTVITWFTSIEPDRTGMALILSAIKSNRRMKHAEFKLAVPNDVDDEGTVTISGNRLDRLIDPADVAAIIRECLS